MVSRQEEIYSDVRVHRKGSNTLAGLIVVLWFIVSLVASQLGLFEAGNGPPIALAVAFLAPVAMFSVLYLVSGGFAEAVSSWSLSFLTWAQSVRVVAGFAFIAYFAMGLLPGVFAIPAGLGDIFAGITAPFVAVYVVRRIPLRKSLYAAWTIYGMFDLVDAMSLGAISTAAFAHAFAIQPTSNPSVATLPLSLIPTFGVPLLFILEILALLKIRHTTEAN